MSALPRSLKSHRTKVSSCIVFAWFLFVPCAIRAQEAQLPLYPVDLAATDDGTVYVVDRNLPGVWKWQDGELSIFFQGSPKYRTPLNAPRCIAIGNDGTVLVGDTSTREVYQVTQGKAEPITGGKIGIPMDIAVAKDGSLYVADLELRRLFKIPAGTIDVEAIASINPRGVGIDATGKVWVVSQNQEQIQVLDSAGNTEAIVSERTFQFPHQVVVDSKGTAYVTDGYAKAVWSIERNAEPKKVVSGEPLLNPVGICLMKDQPLIVDPKVRKVFRLSGGKLEELFELKR